VTRRILAAFLVLIGLLLAGAILPLGISVSDQHWDDYRDGTLSVAQTLASAAEEQVVDHDGWHVLDVTMADVRRDNEGCADMRVVVADTHGHVLRGDPHGLLTDDLIEEGLEGDTSVRNIPGDRIGAVAPIIGQKGVGGFVFFDRSTAPVEQRVTDLWVRLVLAAAGAVVVAFVLAVLLARWVGRPLRRLEQAAEDLGSGELGARAEVPRRPPEARNLAERFNVMAARLETLIYDHRAILADVSHQLRTPLAALRLRMELLAADAPEAGAPEFEGALGELARLSRLVDGLLAVARAENTTVTPGRVDLGTVLAERTEAWRPVAAERDSDLSLEVIDTPAALLRPGHLEQVIDNLVDNALTALGSGGHLLLSARPRGRRVRLLVVDDGPGMARQDMAEAFRRFGTTRTAGTGLGLAIVHRLVTADGGSIELATTPGGGLTVTLDLPAAEDTPAGQG
jgi:signal transduction histidine kinase